jgi:hypothetical protein
MLYRPINGSPHFRPRPATTADCLTIDVYEHRRSGKLSPLADRLMFRLAEAEAVPISIYWERLWHGSFRPWFLCPVGGALAGGHCGFDRGGLVVLAVTHLMRASERRCCK